MLTRKKGKCDTSKCPLRWSTRHPSYLVKTWKTVFVDACVSTDWHQDTHGMWRIKCASKKLLGDSPQSHCCQALPIALVYRTRYRCLYHAVLHKVQMLILLSLIVTVPLHHLLVQWCKFIKIMICLRHFPWDFVSMIPKSRSSAKFQLTSCDIPLLDCRQQICLTALLVSSKGFMTTDQFI